MMNVLSIVPESVVDGPGVRIVIFLAGCPHRCEGCHNPQSWKIGGGEAVALERLKEIIAASPWDGVTFSGGEPFLQADGLAELVTFSKGVGKNVWVYSGYTYEQLCRFGESVQTVLDNADVLVDGPYVQAERDLSLRFRGSRNQRIIELRDIRRSVKVSRHQTGTK